MKEELIGVIRYTAPFGVWFVCLMALPATAACYAVRTVLAAVAGIVCIVAGRRVVGPCLFTLHSSFFTLHQLTHQLARALTYVFFGLLVAVLWIVPEWCPFYATWCVAPFGALPPAAPSPYDPATCGWALTVVKLIGSAFVIAPAEEYFFRNFLYRRLQARDFRAVPLSRFDLSAFLWMVALFTLEHNRPIVAALAGAIYGLLAIRKGMCAAVTAHIVTNLALGLYVICTDAWAFW